MEAGALEAAIAAMKERKIDNDMTERGCCVLAHLTRGRANLGWTTSCHSAPHDVIHLTDRSHDDDDNKRKHGLLSL